MLPPDGLTARKKAMWLEFARLKDAPDKTPKQRQAAERALKIIEAPLRKRMRPDDPRQ